MNRRHFLSLVPAAGALAACGGSKQQKTRLALDWKPEPEFGGFYAADFAKVVESWTYVTSQMCTRSEQPPEVFERIKEGLHAHVNAIKSERGFASWPIYAGSGRKPFRS